MLNHIPRWVHVLMVQAAFYTQTHILCTDKTRTVNLSAVFPWRVSNQCPVSHNVLLNHLDSPGSTESCNSHLPVSDLTFHTSFFFTVGKELL